jgi:L-threonylcarbamoyladenylate synthase
VSILAGYLHGGATLRKATIRYVKTLRLAVNPARLDSEEAQQAIAHAADMLRSGGLVAIPTETVYGLGANALDRNAVSRIFMAKQRPSWDPVIVHIAGPVTDNPMLAALVTDVPESARLLMQAFWPGPLTLLLPRSSAVPDAVTAGRALVGIRMPAHPVAFEVIRRAGVPIAAPSANVFGHISPTSAMHVLDDLDGRIDAVLDAGPTHHGVESTVIDPCMDPPVIYRPGAITAEQVRKAVGSVVAFAPANVGRSSSPESLPSPGISLRHYAPRACLILIDAQLADLPVKLAEASRAYENERLGIMLPVELANGELEAPLRAAAQFSWGRWAAPEELANSLYAGLRALDAQGCTVILCPMPPPLGLGEAIRDRLRKASFPGEQ